MFLALVIGLSAMSPPAPVHGLLWACPYQPCDFDNPHTVCMYPSGINRFSPYFMGHGAQEREFTDEMRECTLHAHNSFRQKLAVGDTHQPPAANMMKLKYSREAEKIVKHWINQGQRGHDGCRRLKDGTNCGQNLWWTSSGDMKGNESADFHNVCYGSIAAYWSEIDMLKGRTTEDIEHYKYVSGTGHYTAMTWASVTHVGCAWAQGANDYSYMPHALLRPLAAGCNYVGTVNLIGGEQYKVGQNCTQCPKGAHCSVRYPGLCTFESKKQEYTLIIE